MKSYRNFTKAFLLSILIYFPSQLQGQPPYYMTPGTVNIPCPYPATDYFVDQTTVPNGGVGGGSCGSSNSYNYAENQDVTETFCDTAGLCLTVNFESNSVGICANDTLFMYDGISALSPPLASSTFPLGFITNYTAGTPVPMLAGGSCVTFRFKSNSDGSTAKGWKIYFSCGTCLSAPLNDDCDSATMLIPGASCTYINGSTYLATASSGIPSCAGTPNDDVWYSFIANNSAQTISVSGSNGTNPVVQVFSGTCTSLTSINCTNLTGTNGTETINLTGLTVNDTYYFRIYDFSNSATNINYTFKTCVSGGSVQDCSGSAEVCSTSTVYGSSAGYGTIEYDVATFGCLIGGEHRSSWYRFTFASAGTFNLTITPTGSQDIDYAIWGPYTAQTCPVTGAPARCSYAANNGMTGGLNSTSVDFSEAAIGDGYTKEITVSSGQVYQLLIDVFSGTSNDFTVNWSLGGGATFNNCILPVELISFYGEKQEEMNILRWSTASEVNNDYFTPERSADAVQYIPLSDIPAVGFSTTLQTYEYKDQRPLIGINYYRLKQTDYDGSFTYSHVISLDNGSGNLFNTEIFPNPSLEIFNLNVYAPENSSAEFQIYNPLGQVFIRRSIQLLQGKNNFPIDLSAYGNGIYSMRLSIGNYAYSFTGKLVKL